jgi:hypothetical protein
MARRILGAGGSRQYVSLAPLIGPDARSLRVVQVIVPVVRRARASGIVAVTTVLAAGRR